MPLLVGLDGVQKMSQSLGNYVSIREAPDQMFGKLMSIPDHLVGQYVALGSDLNKQEVHEIEETASSGGPAAGKAKRKMARVLVALYHSDAAADEAEAAFDRQFKERQAPKDMPTKIIPGDSIEDGRAYMPRVLVEVGLASSGSEARRLIEQSGVKINGETMSGQWAPVEDLERAVVQVGKKKFVRLTTGDSSGPIKTVRRDPNRGK